MHSRNVDRYYAKPWDYTGEEQVIVPKGDRVEWREGEK